MNTALAALTSIALLATTAIPAVAQVKPVAPPVSQSVPRPEATREIQLETGRRSADYQERWMMFGGGRLARNVTQPTLTAFLPDPAKATGAAVVVAPGGGFLFLSMDNEGYPIASWLADHGVAAFVLKYTLNRTSDDDAKFGAEAMRMFAAASAKGGNVVPTEPRSTQDAIAALDYVRANAGRWNIDRDRVGMIGFSAGAITTLNAVLEGKPAERPAFFGYVYGPMSAVEVPNAAPPMFAALAIDDDLFGKQGFGIVDAWHRAGRPVELHAYERGGHGFGAGKAGTTSTGLLDQFLAWMRARGLLDRKQ
jgi:acetyl esterase/lipase